MSIYEDNLVEDSDEEVEQDSSEGKKGSSGNHRQSK